MMSNQNEQRDTNKNGLSWYDSAYINKLDRAGVVRGYAKHTNYTLRSGLKEGQKQHLSLAVSRETLATTRGADALKPPNHVIEKFAVVYASTTVVMWLFLIVQYR